MYTLVLVGGTGQRFGLTVGLLHLLGIAELPESVIILDAEGSRRDQRNPVTEGVDRLLRWGRPDLRIDRIAPYAGGSGNGAVDVSDAVGAAGSRLFPLCLTTEEEGLGIERGFFANPKTASVVFRALLDGEGGKTRLQALLGDDSSGAPERPVVIVGSLAGGTGAGTLHEVAHAYRRRGAKQILGIAFSHYFQVDEDEITTARLMLNAKIGFRHLLKPENLSKFDALTLIGPPAGARLPEPSAEGVETPHSFSGFLAAASLISDRGSRLWGEVDDFRRALSKQDPAPTYITIFGAHSGEHFIRDGDLEFPIAGDPRGAGRGGSAPGDILHPGAKAALTAQGDFAKFRPTVAAGTGALFVEQKLGPVLTKALRSLDDTLRIRASHVARLEEHIKGSTGSAQRDLNNLLRWLEAMKKEGSLELSHNSPRVRAQSWRRCIHGRERAQDASPHEIFAQGWSRDLAKGQWSLSSGQKPAAGNAVLFPYFEGTVAQPPAGRPGRVDLRPESIQLDGEILDRCYPTPLGPALAFSTSLKLRRRDAVKQAETLWLGVALGWLEMIRVDLPGSPQLFDQLVAKFDGRCRHLYLLQIARECPVRRELIGGAIGATHPDCGLWLGVREEHREGCAALDEALGNEERARALRVLAAWWQSFKNPPRGESGGLPVWARVVSGLLADGPEAIDFDAVRTVGPLLLACNDGEGRTEPVYLFRYEPERGPKVDRFLASVGQGRQKVPPSFAPARLADAADENRVEALLTSGYLEWASREEPAGGASMEEIEAGLTAVSLDRDALRHFKLSSENLRGRPSMSIPDILWDRSEDRRFVEIPEAPPAASIRDLSFLDRLPEIQGVHFHQARHEWIVWLQDSIYNKTSVLRRSAGDSSVIEAQAGWRLRFPSNTRYLTVGDILVPNLMVLVGQDGREILPGIPVKSEFIDLIACEDNQPQGTRTADGASFDFQLLGGGRVQPSFALRNLHPEERLHLEVWPNVQGDAWKTYWCGVETDNPEETADLASKGFARGSTGHYEVAGAHNGSGYWTIAGRPRLVWLGDKTRGGGFVVFRNQGRPTGSEGHDGDSVLAVDFGTFRSTLVVDPTGRSGDPTTEVRSFEVDGLVIVGQDQKNAKFWNDRHKLLPRLPPIASEKRSASLSAAVLPSALAAGIETSFGEHGYPFRDFAIPTRKLERMKNVDGLKWREDPPGAEARRSYLRALLTLGAAEAYRLGAKDILVRYSFPLAMDHRQRGILEQDFEVATKWVQDVPLGGNVKVRCQLGASESEAGIHSAEGGGTWIATLDLGGETLDLGLFEWSRESRNLRAWDSVRLGGNLVADALASRSKWADGEVRWRVETDYDVARPQQADVERLFFLAVEYAARFISGMLQHEAGESFTGQIDVVLLGSGWRWHRALTKGPLASFEEDAFQRMFVDFLRDRIRELVPGCEAVLSLNAKVLQAGREKLAVAIGLARLPVDGPPTHTNVCAPNGLDESNGVAWTTVIKSAVPHPPADSVSSTPAFPKVFAAKLGDNHPAARLPASATKSIRGAVRSRLESGLQGYRHRTALGIVYELLVKDWFPHN